MSVTQMKKKKTLYNQKRWEFEIDLWTLTKDDVYHPNHSKRPNKFQWVYCSMPLFQHPCTCIIDAAETIEKIMSMWHFIIW